MDTAQRSDGRHNDLLVATPVYVLLSLAAFCLSGCGNPARTQTNPTREIVVEIPEGVPLPLIGPPPQGCSARQATYFNRVTFIQNFRSVSNAAAGVVPGPVGGGG
jgi:hypothetical protein